jgi:hypothetical protein
VAAIHVEFRQHTQLLGRACDEVGEAAHQLARARERKADLTAEQHRPDRVQPILEGRDDSEIAAAAAQRTDHLSHARLWHTKRSPRGTTRFLNNKVQGKAPGVMIDPDGHNIEVVRHERVPATPGRP